MDDTKELEVDYYELGKSPKVSEYYVLKKEKEGQKSQTPEVKKVSIHELEKRANHNPLDIRNRVNFMERRIEEFEKNLALVNSNLDEYRKYVDKKFTDINQRMEKLENPEKKEKISEEVKGELDSLKSVVERISTVNEEIKTKIPEMLRDLEKRVNKSSKKLSFIEDEVKKKEKEEFNRPIILE
jgi:chromosome segregation ATPase